MNQRRLNTIKARVRARRGDNSTVICQYLTLSLDHTCGDPRCLDREHLKPVKGFQKIAEPQRPTEARFVIMCVLGAVTLRKSFEECLKQEIRDQPDGFYWIIESA